MKSRSLVGPVLLVLTGGLFLVNNIRPDLVSWDALARYWPLILIGWGFLRLLEILIWRLKGAPLPRYGISGGEWVAIVFICLIGAGLSVARRHSFQFPPIVVRGPGLEIFGESYDFPVSVRAPAGKVSRIVIQMPRGDVRITGADVQEVSLEGRKTVRAFHRREAEEANKSTPVDIVTEGDRLVVRVKEEAEGARRMSVDLKLTVPRGSSIQASGRYGDFDVTSVDGDVEVTSGNAGVRLQEIGGNIRVDLRRSNIVRAVNAKGSVSILGRGNDLELDNIAGPVTVNGYFSGDLRCRRLAKPFVFQSGATELAVERVPGELKMDLGDLSATEVVGPVRLTAKSRDVRIEDFSAGITLRLERGDVELDPRRAPTGDIDVSTRAGDVELKLPRGGNFRLSASTERGEVDNEFGPPLQTKSSGRGAEITGSVGNGPQIRVSTGLGSIKVRKE